MKKQLLLFCFFSCSVITFSQSDTLVESIIGHSREVEDQGNYDYAVELLRSNIRKYNSNPELRAELANIYYRGEEYQKTIKQCRKFKRKFEPIASIYQLEAHAYINKGKVEKARKALIDGLEELPDEGILYTERGRLSMYKENYEGALKWFEEGIEKAPNYPGNYYWASKIYLQSTEELWGLLYGEIFVNLEPFTSRTGEISRLLYETLNREIIFYNDTAISVNICKDANFTVSAEDSSEYVSYGQDIIEPTIKAALKGIDRLTIYNINKYRISFLEHYEKQDKDKYPDHFLIELHEELMKQGHFEAYNFWLFMMGNPEEFKRWEGDNSSQWKRFTQWFENYNFKVESTDAYYSKQFR